MCAEWNGRCFLTTLNISALSRIFTVAIYQVRLMRRFRKKSIYRHIKIYRSLVGFRFRVNLCAKLSRCRSTGFSLAQTSPRTRDFLLIVVRTDDNRSVRTTIIRSEKRKSHRYGYSDEALDESARRSDDSAVMQFASFPAVVSESRWK